MDESDVVTKVSAVKIGVDRDFENVLGSYLSFSLNVFPKYI